MPKSPSLPAEGGCRCGKVRFQLTAEPMLTAACHCTGCQRMTGGAYSLTVVMPGSGFSLLIGEPVIGGMHGNPQHFFCPHCMSWVFTRLVDMDVVNVRATMLDDTAWFTPYIETYTSEKLAWATTPAVHSYEKFPPFEAYETLVAEYASTD